MSVESAQAASVAWLLGPKVRDITAQLGIQGLKARYIRCGYDVSGFQPYNCCPLLTQPFGLGCYATGLRP
jgi:hypothetical protein